MEWFFNLLRQSPELAIFVTLVLGFALGRIKVGNFSLGLVTGVLLMGVLVGQLGITIAPVVKSAFFLLFLFAVGYSVGPQFVHGLKKEGLPQMAFAAIVCVVCLAVTWGAALIAGFDAGNSAGLLSGANTISAVIGVATDMIGHTGATAADKHKMINEIPVAYAVTYIFGTAGTAWFLSYVGPKLLGGNLVTKCKEYEKQLGGSIAEEDPSSESAYSGAAFRVYEIDNQFFKGGKTVAQAEAMLLEQGWPLYVDRIRNSDGRIVDMITPETVLNNGERVLLNAPVDTLLADMQLIGHEVADLGLMGGFRVEVLRVRLNNKNIAGRTLEQMKGRRSRYGVIIRSIERGGVKVPLLPALRLQRGDVVELEGTKKNVDRFAAQLGYAERPTNVTDLLYVALGIVLGGVLGSLMVRVGNIPFSLSASGGVLIAGIVFGWLHSLRPTAGSVPAASLWLMNNLGLNVFIAVVGISAGPDFVAGLKASGVSLFVAGIAVSILPMLAGLLLGRYVFKFHPGITLGACAGSRVTTAALGAIQDAAQSRVPALSYTVTYAVGNTLLIIWGVVIVLLMS